MEVRDLSPTPVALSSAQEDRVLVERARYGDEDAFAQLVTKYQDRTICIAKNFVLDDEWARDVAQEAFLRVYRCLDRYDPKYRFYTWFYRLVVHLAIDHLRRTRKATEILTDRTEDLSQTADVTGRSLESSETQGRVMETLDRVPLKYRVLLVLRDIEGFTSKEISEIAGWNHATVRWRLHRARKLFRNAWAEAGYREEF